MRILAVVDTPGGTSTFQLATGELDTTADDMPAALRQIPEVLREVADQIDAGIARNPQ